MAVVHRFMVFAFVTAEAMVFGTAASILAASWRVVERVAPLAFLCVKWSVALLAYSLLFSIIYHACMNFVEDATRDVVYVLVPDFRAWSLC